MTRQLGPTDLKRLHREWNHRSSGRIALLLDGVGSPWNVGSITRTAAAYRVEHVYVAGGGMTPGHPKAGKTALGTDRYLTWSIHDKGLDAVAAAQADGLRVVGLELAEGATPLHELPAGPAVCLAVGHEDHGLTPATLAACDAVAYLPLLGRVGSLNVATATAIALYELRRQGWQDATHPEQTDPEQTHPDQVGAGQAGADPTDVEIDQPRAADSRPSG